MALLAGGLIEAVDAAVLAIAVPSDRWGIADPPVVAWNQRLAACPALARQLVDRPLFGPAFDALCLAADALSARLEAWRWTHVASPGLCLVIDGSAVILSIGRPPVDADCGWLLGLVDRLRANDGAVMIRPPERDGIWSLIQAEGSTLH